MCIESTNCEDCIHYSSKYHNDTFRMRAWCDAGHGWVGIGYWRCHDYRARCDKR